jgi:ATP-binding cassette subfamily B (MDR/TAP) protein 1
MSVMMSVFSISNIVAPLNSAVKAAGAACGFFTMIDAPAVKKEGLKAPDVSASEDILFKQVTFAYPSRPHVKVLDNFDIRFEAGKLTAIVGPSGSGKSTVVGLIERWYELTMEDNDQTERISIDDENSKTSVSGEEKIAVALSGTITIGGRDIRDLDLKWWRSQIGLVQQEPFIFNDTIYNNVAHGLVGTKFEKEDVETKKKLVEEACKEAFADEFISRLPQVRFFPFPILRFVPGDTAMSRTSLLLATLEYPSNLIISTCATMVWVWNSACWLLILLDFLCRPCASVFASR